MRTIHYDDIVNAVKKLCIKATCELPVDVTECMQQFEQNETSPLGRSILNDCIENGKIAKNTQSPICQDTGFAVFFIECGYDVTIDKKRLNDAINQGVIEGYETGYLRKSIVKDPIFGRVNTGDNTPAIIHFSQVEGDKLKIMFAPKGGGSENMSKIAMLKPSQGRQGVADFIVDTVVNAGGNPCPPVIVGVGVGGTFEKCAILAKQSLLRTIGSTNPNPDYAVLEQEILERINASGVGPQGLGGRATALAVHITPFPCHIASLPVAVNLNCHVARHAECEL